MNRARTEVLRYRNLVLVLCVTAMLARGAEQMPDISGESLSGKPVAFPAATLGSVAILCIGFSRASQHQIRPWSERLAKRFRDDKRVLIYSAAVLEDAPRIIRGMVVRNLKSGIPAPQHDRFVVIVHGESKLKRITAYDQPEDAYILLLDPAGTIQWRTHGAVSDVTFRVLSNRAYALLNH